MRAETHKVSDPELHTILRAARSVLPPAVAVHAARIRATHAQLTPEEEEHVAGAVPKRRREFAAGRACARIALAQIGVAAPSIPAGPTREPVWPHGIVGSLSHDGDFCLAAVQRGSVVRGIGVDVAAATPLDAALIDRICTRAERRELALVNVTALGCDPHKIVFCVKEAVYKCVFPLRGHVFGFRAVCLTLNPLLGEASIRDSDPALGPALEAHLQCRFRVAAGHVIAGAWIEPSAERRAA